MQKLLFIAAAIFVASTFAVQGDCSSYYCLKTGDTCSGFCGTCFTDLQACVIAAGANQTSICSCVATAITCINARTDKAICQVSLKANSRINGNCTTQAGANCASCAIIDAYPDPPKISAVPTCNLNNDYCNEAGVCAARKAPGAACTGAVGLVGECASTANPATGYACKAGTCQRVSKSYANDNCADATDCVGTMNCTGGVCVGKANGTACTQSAECAPGHYCASLVCTPFLATGTNCTRLTFDGCGPASICNTVTGKCSLKYQNPVGSACFSSAECTFGLYCNTNFVTAGNCTAVPPTPICYNNTDCANSGVGSTCQCTLTRTDGKGQCSAVAVDTTPMGRCVTEAGNLLTCSTTNMCRDNPVADSFTCVGTKCKTQLNAYNTCLGVADPYATICAVPTSAPTAATGNGGSATNTPSTGSASSFAIGAAVLAVGAAML